MMAVFERISDHQLVFLKLSFREEKGTSILNLDQLGTQLNQPACASDKAIIKWVLSLNCCPQGKPYCVGAALRSDNTVDFYHNFNLVQTNSSQFEDIDIDFNYLYLKEFEREGEVRIHRIKCTWQQDIGLRVATGMSYKKKVSDVKWANIMQKRVAGYLKLYRSIIIFDCFFVVAHRSFVSAYNLSTDMWEHICYKDFVRQLAITLRTVKRPSDERKGFITDVKNMYRYTEKYKLAVVVGVSEIHYLTIDHECGLLEPQNHRVMKLSDPIRRVFRDELTFYGCFVLSFSPTERKSCTLIMHEEGVNKFNTLCLYP